MVYFTDPKRHEDLGGSLANGHQGDRFVQDNTLQIVLAVTAAVACSAVLIACAICFRSRRNAARRKSMLGGIMLDIDGPSPFSVALNGQLMPQSGKGTYHALDIVGERPQVELDDEVASSQDSSSMDGTHSAHLSSDNLDNITNMNFDDIPTSRKLKMMRHSKSTGNILQNISEYREYDITVAFNIDHDNENSVLRVTLHSVSDLPFKAQMADIYAKCFLFPSCTEGQVSSIIKGDEVVLFDEMFQFENVSHSELDVSTLRISLYTRSRKRGKSKDNFIAECFLKFSDIDLNLPMPIEKEVPAQRKRIKKQSTADKLLIRALGEMFVLLQYQSMANRMKVFLRRAQNLPKSDRLLGQPVHYVRINLLKDGNVVQYKETRTQSGYSPVWNEPFLFDIPSADIDNHSVEFVIMRGKLYSKDGVVGHVTIGTRRHQSRKQPLERDAPTTCSGNSKMAPHTSGFQVLKNQI
ncbi:hypothetical protein FSP39_019094 [Pinctada imbricata]|uniref:C2 domain-containing protein n=1 Tax=Pinctada imbricata TaxID=66713 RepID=A0AA88YBU4_PINIB|nr:hypothetical protein FSP39_019094 [Pinctada imbricata]